MCGIVGYIGKNNSVPILLGGLNRLEYRGYDSAGMVFLDEKKNNLAKSIKAVGKVKLLEKKIKGNESGKIGIAHTRWATHGKPSLANCHPHKDCKGNVWVVHNGIIENYLELKNKLIKKGHRFFSETDTEVIAHLIEHFLDQGMSKKKALEKALENIEGTYGLAVLFSGDQEKILVARKGSPLIIGVGKGESFVASDVAAIVNYTRKVAYLDENEIAEVFADKFYVSRIGEKKKIKKNLSEVEWTIEGAKKQGYAHYMLKEIMEQPEVIENSIRGRAEKFIQEDSDFILGGLSDISNKIGQTKKIIIVSCGTSYYAGLVGKYILEEYAGISTEVEYASEFRYRKPVIDKKTAVLAISQSGETADTLEAVREAKLKGALTLGIVNTVGSTIAKETDAGVYNHAGPEIGVASTKTFTSQLAILVLLALVFGRQRNMSFVMGKRIAEELKKIPQLLREILEEKHKIKKIAQKYQSFENWFFLGRKYNFPIACEGALKTKEISYIHAEGYPVGEMKHGPIALIDSSFGSVFIVPKDSVYKKVINGMEEVKARGGKILAIATKGDKRVKKIADDVIYIPKTLEMLTPILSVAPLQLLAYYFGVARGYDVDKPRNLAKSVTVE